jgi:hypothetical protein
VEPLAEDEEVPVAEGEDREAARLELLGIVDPVINSLKERMMRYAEDPDKARAQFNRDEILARGQEKAALMNRGEESSLRQVSRITHLLMKIKEAARTKNIENEEWSQYVTEKKTA